MNSDPTVFRSGLVHGVNSKDLFLHLFFATPGPTSGLTWGDCKPPPHTWFPSCRPRCPSCPQDHLQKRRRGSVLGAKDATLWGASNTRRHAWIYSEHMGTLVTWDLSWQSAAHNHTHPCSRPTPVRPQESTFQSSCLMFSEQTRLCLSVGFAGWTASEVQEKVDSLSCGCIFAGERPSCQIRLLWKHECSKYFQNKPPVPSIVEHPFYFSSLCTWSQGYSQVTVVFITTRGVWKTFPNIKQPLWVLCFYICGSRRNACEAQCQFCALVMMLNIGFAVHI